MVSVQFVGLFSLQLVVFRQGSASLRHVLSCYAGLGRLGANFYAPEVRVLVLSEANLLFF
jgi:hypothetical protein